MSACDSDHPNRLTGSEAATLIYSGSLTSAALVRSCLDRIQERPDIGAWVHLDQDLTLRNAEVLDAIPKAERRGRLFGVPLAIKDLFYTADMPTRHGSSRYAEDETRFEASVVSLLRKSGMLILGKSVTTEYAFTMNGKATKNPHNLEHTPGGSSSGSAAAVADYQCPISVGTQTFGSIGRPASYCGVYGYKPTHGAVSCFGGKFLAPTLDTIGFFSRSVADLQALADILGIAPYPAPQSPETEEELSTLASRRVAWCRTPAWHRASAESQDILGSAVSSLAKHGCKVEELVLPPAFDKALAWHRTIAVYELATHMRSETTGGMGEKESDHPLDPMLQAFIDEGQATTIQQYAEAIDGYSQLRPLFDELSGAYDCIVTVSATGEPPVGQEWTGDSSCNTMFTALHTPTLTVPGWGGRNKLPIGIQLVAPRWNDVQLLEIGERVGSVFSTEGNWRSAL